MEAEPQREDEVQAIVQLEIEHVFMHRLVNNEMTLFTSGTFKIAKLQNSRGQPIYFLNLNSFYYSIQPTTFFIKVVYSDTVAYVFPHFQNGLSAFSILPNPELIRLLDELLGNVAKLVDIKTALETPELKAMIDLHYIQLEREQIYYPDSIKKAITITGSFFNKAFTKIGGYIKSGVEKCGDYLNSKISEGEPTQMSSQSKQRWGKVKEGTSSVINVSVEYANKILNPVIAKTKQYATHFEGKIDHSDNQTVKYAKELAQVSGRAIGDAFTGLVKGGTEVVKEIGSQSKKIITKKYGEEVIKTFTGQKEQMHPQQAQLHPQVPPQSHKVKQQSQKQNSNDRLVEKSSQNLYPSLEK